MHHNCKLKFIEVSFFFLINKGPNELEDIIWELALREYLLCLQACDVAKFIHICDIEILFIFNILFYAHAIRCKGLLLWLLLDRLLNELTSLGLSIRVETIIKLWINDWCLSLRWFLWAYFRILWSFDALKDTLLRYFNSVLSICY